MVVLRSSSSGNALLRIPRLQLPRVQVLQAGYLLLLAHGLAVGYYGNIREPLTPYFSGREDELAGVAMAIVDQIGALKIRDWRDNNDVLNRMRGEIDDIFYEKAAQMGFDLPLELQDKLIDECIEIAIANED